MVSCGALKVKDGPAEPPGASPKPEVEQRPHQVVSSQHGEGAGGQGPHVDGKAAGGMDQQTTQLRRNEHITHAIMKASQAQNHRTAQFLNDTHVAEEGRGMHGIVPNK